MLIIVYYKYFGGNFVIIAFIVISLFLFFIPLPLYLKFFFRDNKLSVFVYSFKIYPRRSVKKLIEEPKKHTFYPKVLYIKIFQNIYNKSGHFLYKSALKIDFDIKYGLNDAYTTAMSYGILQSLINSGYYFFNRIFRIVSYKPNIKLKYDEFFLEFTVKSIIYINLAKIIYITLLIYISFRKGAKENLNPKEAV